MTAQTGVPEAQRDPATLVIVKVPAIGDGPRSADETVRKLTKVERMRRSGVLEPHEAAACERFADLAALAWDTTGCTAAYDIVSTGGGPAHAPDTLMAKTIDIQYARDEYGRLVDGIPAAYLKPFEAVICRNQGVGLVAADAFETLARSRAEERLRTVIRFVANKIAERLGSQLAMADALPPRPPSPRPTVTQQAPSEPRVSLFDRISAAVDRADSRGEEPTELHIGKPAHDELLRELGRPIDAEITSFRELGVVLRPDWGFSWVARQPVSLAA